MKNRKFVLNFSPTGMIPTKTMTPHVPVSPEEIVVQVLEACSLGANMIYLHARDPISGEPTYKKEVYAALSWLCLKARCREIIPCSWTGCDSTLGPLQPMDDAGLKEVLPKNW